MGSEKCVAIIIVNWKSWKDTILAAELCLRLEGFHGKIIIVDNASPDDSVPQIEKWIAGFAPQINPNDLIDELRPIMDLPRLTELRGVSIETSSMAHPRIQDECCVHLLKSDLNSGFSAANNIAISYANTIGKFDAYWLLNPDAFPKPSALKELINHIENWDQPTVAGSVLLEYSSPKIVQAVGAKLNNFTLTPSHQLEGEPLSNLGMFPDKIIVEYPVGASLILNHAFIDKCGTLEETYFLYYEEIDLARRAEKSNVFIVKNSVVFHKGGASTSPNGRRNVSPLSEFYYTRSRIIFARKQGFFYVSKAILGTFGSVVKRILTGKFSRLIIISRAVISGFRVPLA